MGAQSYSFRKFSFEDSVKCLKEAGLSDMEFCGVHFPCDPDAPELGNVREVLAREGVNITSYGVEGFGADAAANRRKFMFARAMGIRILTADPAPESFDNLEALCAEFNVKIAIHNHGPGARYDSIEDVLNAVDGRHPFIGACIDTGHFIRSGVKPHEAVEALGARVHSLHLKDWISGGEEQILGEGDLDLRALATALRAIGFHGPMVMEYEESPDNPVPDMKRGWANWQAVWKA